MALNPLRATTDNVSLLNEFTERVETRQAPGDALEVLHDWVSNKFPLSVLGAARTYLKGPSWRSPRLGRDVFLHASAPEGWWDEYAAMASRQQDPAATQIGGDELPHGAEFWDSLRDQTHPFFGEGHCFRVALPPAAAYPALPGAWLTEWAGSLRWFRTEATREHVDLAARRLGGHATEFRDPQVPQPFDKGALKYYRRLKDAFDPKAIFNRGRLFQEIGQEAVTEANP